MWNCGLSKWPVCLFLAWLEACCWGKACRPSGSRGTQLKACWSTCSCDCQSHGSVSMRGRTGRCEFCSSGWFSTCLKNWYREVDSGRFRNTTGRRYWMWEVVFYLVPKSTSPKGGWLCVSWQGQQHCWVSLPLQSGMLSDCKSVWDTGPSHAHSLSHSQANEGAVFRPAASHLSHNDNVFKHLTIKTPCTESIMNVKIVLQMKKCKKYFFYREKYCSCSILHPVFLLLCTESFNILHVPYIMIDWERHFHIEKSFSAPPAS